MLAKPSNTKFEFTDVDGVATGGNGADMLAGGAGDDQISGGNQSDLILGGAGDDMLSGGNGADTLDGMEGADVLDGGNGKDVVVAGAPGNLAGPDDSLSEAPSGPEKFMPTVLQGGNGKDTLISGVGADVMIGGRAPDTFVFHQSHGNDTIVDFRNDVIDLSSLGLNGFEDLNIAGDENAIIDTGHGTIMLVGVDPSQITADDFMF